MDVCETHCRMLGRIHLNGCLLGDRAAASLMRMMVGEGEVRAYREAAPLAGEYGYYYEPLLKEWIAFDNRGGTCWVETYKHEKGAKEALCDGDELFVD